MGLGKQAKTLSKGQVEAVLGYLAKTRWPTRNRAIFLLSIKAGLRAKEIASLTWRMVTDARGQIGQAIHLENRASKGQSGRVIPINEELRTALVEYSKTIWMPRQPVPDREREVEGNVTASDRQSVLALVSARRLPWLFQPQRPTHFHHQYRKEDLNRGRIAAGRADAGRSHQLADDAKVHRGQSGRAGQDR